MKLEGTDVCICLHTALRKYCDSKITSAAYNLIHLICNTKLKPKHCPWHLFGDMVAEIMSAGQRPLMAVKHSIHHLDDQYFKRVIEPRRKKGKSAYPKDARTWLHALQCTLECFDEHDLGAFVALLERDEA